MTATLIGLVVRAATFALFHWREAGGVHKGRLHFLRERAFFFGLGFDLRPFRIGLKLFPVFLGGFAARVRQDIDEGVLRFRIAALRSPIADHFHVVLLKNRSGVIAEA